MTQFHNSPYENADEAAQGAVGALTHMASFRARFTGSQFEEKQPLRMRFFTQFHLDQFQDALEDLISSDPERFPLGAMVSSDEYETVYLTSLVVRTKTGHEYTVHVVAQYIP